MKTDIRARSSYPFFIFIDIPSRYNIFVLLYFCGNYIKLKLYDVIRLVPELRQLITA